MTKLHRASLVAVVVVCAAASEVLEAVVPFSACGVVDCGLVLVLVPAVVVVVGNGKPTVVKGPTVVRKGVVVNGRTKLRVLKPITNIAGIIANP